MTPARVLFVFVDGVGLGLSGPLNPLSEVPLPILARLGGGRPWIAGTRVDDPEHVFVPIDATLSMEGLPQSGTGQASLFSGVNCARVAGRHYGPFPHSTSKPILDEHNVFSRLKGTRVAARAPDPQEPFAFANPYPQRFFDAMARRDRWTVTTYCCRAAGVRLRTGTDLVAGRAVPADLTGALWPEPDPPPLDEAASGRRLAALAEEHALTLFETWLPDKAGHGRDGLDPAAVLQSLDRFLGGVLDRLSGDTLVLLSSDHGNVEDLNTRSHTRNPVPLVALGPGAAVFRDARSLTDVVPTLVRLVR